MKRLALLAALCLGLVACGGSTRVVLQAKYPTSEYLQITGPADAAQNAAKLVNQATGYGWVSARTVQGPQACKRTFDVIPYSVSDPSLPKPDGQKITFAYYGDDEDEDCYHLPSAFPHGFPLFGGNLRIYQWPSESDTPLSGMGPTLNCGGYDCRPDVPESPCESLGGGCGGYLGEVRGPDVVVYRQSGASGLKRGAIAVYKPSPRVALQCSESGVSVFVDRVIGMPGETVREDGSGHISVRSPGSASWTKLSEPYISAAVRARDTGHLRQQWRVPSGAYFVVGDNRGVSCDSRQWGSVPAARIVGPVVDIVREGKVQKPAGVPG
jgi:signal peptidase I